VVAAAPEVVKVARDQYGYLVNRPVVPFYSEFSTELQVRIQECLQGKKSSDQALKEVQAKALDLAARK
jgi:multiple sugar transport system substrate-binding protein